MSWQTPAPWSQASAALVFTPVEPGMYETRSATRSETATAVSCGSRPAAAVRARSTSSSGTAVREVCTECSSRRELATRSATSAQVGAGDRSAAW